MIEDELSAWEKSERERERREREAEVERLSKLNARAHVEAVKEANENDPRSDAEKQQAIRVTCMHGKYTATLDIATKLLAASVRTVPGPKGPSGLPTTSYTGHIQPAVAVDLALRLQEELDRIMGPAINMAHETLDALREQREKGVK